MSNNKVSIIIPVYNNEKYIGKCIDSIINQSYKDLEILVINDGSTDNTKNIIDEYASKDKRIIAIHKENEGVAIARDLGIDKSTGEFLTFIDGDDYIAKDYIQNLVECAKNNQSNLVITGYKAIDENGKVLLEIIPDSYIRFKKEEWVFRLSFVASHLYRTNLWKDNNIRFKTDKSIRAEDLPVALYFGALCDKICILPKSEYYYVQHTGSATNSFKGLGKYKLPYNKLEDVIKEINEKGVVNSCDFYELFVMRILASFISLAKGTSKEKIKELSDYIYYIINTYFPNYRKNKLLKLNNKVNVPFIQKLAVSVMLIAVKTKTLNAFLNIVC